MLIVYNAKIYAPELLSETAFIVCHGRIFALGSDEEILSRFSQFAACIDLQGRTIWPGLIDAHIHLKHLAETQSVIDCETDTIEECLKRIRQAVKNLPEGAWVRGHGWNQNLWDGGYGTSQLLDTVSGDHPVFLSAKSLHAAWVNSRALALAGIDKQTPDPPDGSIQRNGKGEPTGILFENSATQLVQKLIPQPGIPELSIELTDLFPKLWSVGLVGAHDFDDINCWKALQNLHQQGLLKFRVRKNIPYDHLDTFIQAGICSNYGEDKLHAGFVKLFADGALGPQTAAMFTPYAGTTSSGILLLTEKEIYDIGTHAVSHGIGLCVHAIGDLAVHSVINAYEKLRHYERDHNLPHFRHRIEHVQTIVPSDIPRLAKLDIVASVQPVHIPSDMETADRLLGERSRYTFMLNSLRQSGARLIFGSDAPVEPCNPFYGIHAAVTRQRLNGTPADNGWHAEQRLTLMETLQGFTSTPHESLGHDFTCGRIKPGYNADFIVLPSDPFLMDSFQLGSILPEATFIGGECVYQSSDSELDLQTK